MLYQKKNVDFSNAFGYILIECLPIGDASGPPLQVVLFRANIIDFLILRLLFRSSFIVKRREKGKAARRMAAMSMRR